MSLVMENVSFRYPDGVFGFFCESFSIQTGETVIVRGPNGSGKSTLLKLLIGVMQPIGGDIYCDGEETAQLSLFELGERIGYLFQEPERQLFASTVLEELTILSDLLGRVDDHADQKARTLLAQFGLAGYEQRSVLTLSRGEKQRLALCAILMQEPSYLLLDEPTTGLDQRNRARLRESLGELVKRDVGIVLVTHDDECSCWGDRVVQLEAGVVAS